MSLVTDYLNINNNLSHSTGKTSSTLENSDLIPADSVANIPVLNHFEYLASTSPNHINILQPSSFESDCLDLPGMDLVSSTLDSTNTDVRPDPLGLNKSGDKRLGSNQF